MKLYSVTTPTYDMI